MKNLENSHELSCDVAIVGAGILGQAHALAFAKRGLKVHVFDRSPQPLGASIRNFGMIWTIGQLGTPMETVALQSNQIWRELLQESGIWHEITGSLHLAYASDERQVMQEFHESCEVMKSHRRMISADEVLAQSPAVNPEGLLGGLHSNVELHVDPRQVLAELPGYLHSQYGVEFHWSYAVTHVETGRLVAGNQEHRAGLIVICSGDDYETLFADHLQASTLSRCKLQMMRAMPKSGWKIGPMLCAGLTLPHYKNFANCASLPALRERFLHQYPDHIRWGIHVLVSQHGTGELVLGDTHEYSRTVTPFSNEKLDQLVLDYLQTFLPVQDLEIFSKWIGVYSTFDGAPVYKSSPLPEVHVITGVGGAGMTLSMGLGEQTASRILS